MKVVICGAGQVGLSLVNALHQAYDVVVIESCSGILEKIQKKYDIQGIKGSACDPRILEKAELGPDSALIGVTGNDEVNLTACFIAKRLFSVNWTAARLRLGGYLVGEWETSLRQAFGIDLFLSPEKDVAESILKSFQIRHTFDTLSLSQKRILIMGLQVHSESPLIGQSLKELSENFKGFSGDLFYVIRNYQPFIPKPHDRICVHDALYCAVPQKEAISLMRAWGYPQDKMRRVIVMGATLVSHYLLKKFYDLEISELVVIDEDEDNLKQLASEYPDALLLHGSPLNPELLAEANISEAGYTIALTSDDTLNILASLMAGSYGVPHPIALVQTTDSLSSLFTLGIEKMIHPSQLIRARLLQRLTQTYVDVFYPLEGGHSGTLIEAILQEGAPAIGKSPEDLRHETFKVIAVIRDEKVHWQVDILRLKDRVVLIVFRDGLMRFQKYFDPDF